MTLDSKVYQGILENDVIKVIEGDIFGDCNFTSLEFQQKMSYCLLL
ncbi:Rv2993c-like domain-containing protein [Lentibacillus amyloliquefaciens]